MFTFIVLISGYVYIHYVKRERERQIETDRERPRNKGENIPVGTCMVLHYMDLVLDLLDTSSIMAFPLPT